MRNGQVAGQDRPGEPQSRGPQVCRARHRLTCTSAPERNVPDAFLPHLYRPRQPRRFWHMPERPIRRAPLPPYTATHHTRADISSPAYRGAGTFLRKLLVLFTCQSRRNSA
ncbi:hypothetical protein Bbelb_308160 [Branchiostoma belcheri]|nr:hypothetical protein Bbelb_308160 [Branchiostoma belcheri]